MNLRPLAACLSLAACAFPAHAAENELSAAEKKAGWTLLFDGKTLNGWRTYAQKPAGGWEVVDGTLHAIAKVKGTELNGLCFFWRIKVLFFLIKQLIHFWLIFFKSSKYGGHFPSKNTGVP